MASRVPSKPRQAPKTVAPARFPGEPAKVGDNSAYREEEERVQLISFIAKATQTGAGVELARAPFDAAKKAHNQVFALAKAANPTFTRKYLEKKMDQMSQPPAENARVKVMEDRHDRWLGIISPEQLKMQTDNATPQEARDEVDWEARGFAQGLRGMSAALPEGIPPRMDQPFLKGHGVGYTEYQKALADSGPGSAKVRERMRAQAAQDFKADNPEVDVEKAARKLKADPKFMSRTPPEQDVATAPDGTTETDVEVAAGTKPASPDDGFEATEEELAAQAGRPVRDEAGEVV